ncbi:hypothetical protein PR048_001132 [Dryococelus australis]|uniref:DUF4371 domain-containing protein n=1 Tax=Dryococelus australis TaxID=614101 RepID=A0ABQ9IHU6_9NEOP|nr:hypothetical protein PR048_001132 [Dryococelus australis]
MGLLEERCLAVPELNQCLKRHNKYLMIVDSTTDVHGMEHFSLCLRFVHPGSLEVNEVLVGLYNPVDSRGKALASAIQDALRRLNLSLDNLRGHYFDGAANMSGRETGV